MKRRILQTLSLIPILLLVTAMCGAFGIQTGDTQLRFYMHKGERAKLFGGGFVNAPDQNGDGIPTVWTYQRPFGEQMHFISLAPDFQLDSYIAPWQFVTPAREQTITGANAFVTTDELTVGQTYEVIVGGCDEPTGGNVGVGECVQLRRYLIIVPFDIPIYDSSSTDGSQAHFRVRWGTPSPLTWDVSTYALLRRDDDTVRIGELHKSRIVRSGIARTDTNLTISDGPRNIQPYYAIVGYDSLGEAVALSPNFRISAEVQTFSLLLPGDGSRVSTTAPTLEWENSGNGVFDLWYGTDSTFLVHEEVNGIPGTTHAITGTLEDHTTYYWKVRAGSGEWSSQTGYSFRTNDVNVAPQPFAQNLPTNGSILETRTPTFSWEPSVDPGDSLTYRLLVSLDFAFTDIVFDSLTTDRQFTLARSLPDDQEYFWKVCAIDEFGLLQWSTAVFSFTIHQPDLPGPFELLSPVWNSEVPVAPSPYPQFSWSRSLDPDPGDVVYYTLWYGTDSLLLTKTIVDHLTDTAYTSPFSLPEHSICYWKVFATDQSGRRRASSVLPYAWPVNSVLDVPTPPLQLMPLPDDTVGTEYIEFTWGRASADPFSQFRYEFWISTNPEFSDTVYYVQPQWLFSHVTVPLLEPGVYYWRVIARVLTFGVGEVGQVSSPATKLVVGNRRLQIRSPLATSNWKIGSPALITWRANYNVERLWLGFSTDNGTTWATIADSVSTAPRHYVWTVPSLSSPCIVRCADVDHPGLYSTSAPFLVTATGNDQAPLMYLPLDSSDVDAAGNGLHALGAETGQFVEDRFDLPNKALVSGAFDTNPIYGCFDHGLSLSVWIRLPDWTQGNHGRVITFPGGARTINIWNHGLIYQVFPGYGYTFPTPPTEQWAHVVTTEDSTGVIRYYVNGTEVAGGTLPPLVPGTYSLSCGGGLAHMDDLRLYNRVLTRDEILALWKDRIPPDRWIHLLSPNGGEALSSGSWTEIRWDRSRPAPARIEFSLDAGLTWTTIADDVPADSTSFAWHIPEFELTECRIRVLEKSLPCINDESDADFIIGPARPIVVAPGWNMVSVPLVPVDSSLHGIFPGAGITAWEFQSGYKSVDVLSSGKGYWIKSLEQDTMTVIGAPRSSKAVPVAVGWNLIGVFDRSVSVTGITSTPDNIVVSDYFGFDNAYARADILESGRGYWVKAVQEGQLLLSGGPAKRHVSASAATSNRITIELYDSTGARASLYLADRNDLSGFHELPPPPPGKVFDARFSGDTDADTLGKPSHNIRISSGVYPLHLWARNLKGREMVCRVLTDKGILTPPLRDGQCLEIRDQIIEICIEEKSDLIEVPKTCMLAQNYPNPFNPLTTIRFGLPTRSFVNLAVFNTLGQQVAILRNGESEAGYHEVRFDASGLSSGVYFYRIQAEDPSLRSGRWFVQVRKMVLTR